MMVSETTLVTLRLEFNELPPGPNSGDGLLRMHWTRRRILFAHWRGIVAATLASQPLQPVPHFSMQQRCSIIALRKGVRFMDWDNFGASLKPVLDALVCEGVLADDNPYVVQSLMLRQQKLKPGETPSLVMWLVTDLTPLPEGRRKPPPKRESRPSGKAR